MSWNPSIDALFSKIRMNPVQLTNRNIKNHLYYKNCSKYFEIPTIVLSVFISSFSVSSVGSDPFLKQGTISLVSCGISMIITILTSSELYMKIAENSANKSELAVQFKTLAIEIFKTLSLPEELREGLGIDYLNKVYTRYINLVENSEILNPMNKKD